MLCQCWTTVNIDTTSASCLVFAGDAARVNGSVANQYYEGVYQVDILFPVIGRWPQLQAGCSLPRWWSELAFCSGRRLRRWATVTPAPGNKSLVLNARTGPTWPTLLAGPQCWMPTWDIPRYYRPASPSQVHHFCSAILLRAHALFSTLTKVYRGCPMQSWKSKNKTSLRPLWTAFKKYIWIERKAICHRFLAWQSCVKS